MFFRHTLIVLLVALFAGSTAVLADEKVDCKQRPDHPNCTPRA